MALHKWLMPKVDLDECKFTTTPDDWTIPGIPELNIRTWECKSGIDKPYEENPRLWEKLTAQMEPSLAIRDGMRTRFNPENVTNAWLKLIEMFVEFGIAADNRPVKLFDNASAPGAFIMAFNYWKTCVYPSEKFEWMASTWLADAYVALGDTYGLARLYPKKFTTHGTKFNGDTTNTKYLRFMGEKYGKMFDIYTSDLGMRIPEGKYNCQEAVNARGNLGQILMGLETLAPGGTLITKQFSHMSSFTISIIAILTSVFEKLYIVKPLTSKPDNSEEYIVGLGYRGAPTVLKDVMYTALEESADGYDIDVRNFLPPLLARTCLSTDFINALMVATREIVANQCTKIDANLREYAWMVTHRKNNPRQEFIDVHISEQIISGWLTKAPFKRMSKNKYIGDVKSERRERH